MTQKYKKLRIVMAGGGTGGHVFPIKSLIEFLSEHPEYSQKVEKLYWFGTKNSLEEKNCHELENHGYKNILRFISIYSGKYRRETYRKSKLKNIPDFFVFLFGIVQSIVYLMRYRIDIVFCKGGYVALPVVLAAALLRRKIVVHESDTHPGLVNKIASRFAQKVFTGFNGALPKSETIGQILSDQIIVDVSPLAKKNTQVLIVGGSQGSKRLYQNILNVLELTKELQSDIDFFVVLGFLNEEMSTAFDRFPNVKVYGFLSQKEMGQLYADCDIAITRGGTTSLAEQKLYAMKQIIVPIPWTHDQYDNARRYVRQYNDISINQRDEDFEVQLAKAIKHFKGYKKPTQTNDKKTIIAQAKMSIRDSLVA